MKAKLLRKLRKKYWENYRILEKDGLFFLQEKVETVTGNGISISHGETWKNVSSSTDFKEALRDARSMISKHMESEILIRRGVPYYAEYQGEIHELI